jgi:hypothetical protein
VSAAVLIVVLRMCASDGAVPRVALHGSAGQAAGCLGLRLARLRVFGQEAPALMIKDYHKF